MDTDTQKLDSPLVTILMLTYNRADLISQSIESVLNQTYENWSLIIIDDGSTDDTISIVSAYKDVRIRYIHHSHNKGLGKRRKESLEHAKGKYVAILDSDDIWTDNNKLSKQIDHMEKDPNCAIIGTFIDLIDHKNRLLGKTTYLTSDKEIRRRILIRNQFAHSSVVMRSLTLQKVNGYRDISYAEDLDLFLQVGRFGTFSNLPEYMTAYRIHKTSESNKKVRMSLAMFSIITYHRRSYPNVLKAYIFNFLRLLKSISRI